MNLDELQSIRDRERQSDSLQQLRESFYQDVGAFIQELRDEREAVAADADDPFDAPEVNRLTDDIKTAEQTVEAIYERRVGKLVKMASFAAADMPTEDEGLTAEERALFEQLVAAIEGNREHVFALVDGEEAPSPTEVVGESAPTGTPDSATHPGAESTASGTSSGGSSTGGAVDAADLMGGGGSASDTGSPGSEQPPASDGESSPDRPAEREARAIADDTDSPQGGAEPSNTPPRGPDDGPTAPAGSPDSTPSEPAGETPAATDSGGSEYVDAAVEESDAEAGVSDDGRQVPAGTEETPEETGPRSDGGARGVERTTVRITEDVGEIFGVDEREYDLSSEDVVTLPSANADPLVDSDAAERID